MRFAIQDNLLGAGNYQDGFRLAHELGFDAVELNFFQKNVTKEHALEISKAAEFSGMKIAAVCGGYLNWIGDFDEGKRQMAVDGIKASLEHIAKMGGKGIIAPAAYGMYARRFPPKRTVEEDRRILMDSLLRIAETAEKYDVMFYLEPLNRYEDHMINTIAEAVPYIDDVGSKHLQILGDIFHMNL